MAENTDVLNLDRPNGRLPDTENKPLLEPMINVDVEDRLLRELKERLFPNDIAGILQSAITGDLYWHDQLWHLMCDNWPRLSTNMQKLRRAVSSIDYDVNAYVEDGESKPTKSALEKASFVKKALFGMHGDPARSRRDFKDTLEDLLDSWVSGFTVLEINWENRKGLGIVPESTRWIPARYYRYPYEMGEEDRLMLNPSGDLGGTQLFDFPLYKFLVCVKPSHANHPVFSATMRSLTQWYISARFGLEWFMTYSQLYGIPQRIAYYEPGDDQVRLALISMLRNSGAATWGVFPRNTEVQIQSGAGAGGHMPQERLIEQADRICDILLLGQTLTTDVHESGSRALGTVHKSEWNEIKESVAQYVAKIISTQLIPGIIAYNFSDQEEMPTIRPVIDAPIDLFALSQALKVICVDMKVPISLKDLYNRMELPQPEPNEELYEAPEAPEAPAPGMHLFSEPGITTPEGKGKNRDYSSGEPPGATPPNSQSANSEAQASHTSCNHGVVTAADDAQERKKRDELTEKILLALLLLYGPSGGGESMRTRLEGYSTQQLQNLAAKTADLSKAAPETTHQVIPSLEDLLARPAGEIAGAPQRTVEETAQAQVVERYFYRNGDLIKGVHWHSIMDERTTEQCRVLHDKEWSYPDMTPIGHDVPWPGYPPIFYNCRSSVMPILRTE